jgi:cytochrome c-type biogenesis protein CcmH
MRTAIRLILAMTAGPLLLGFAAHAVRAQSGPAPLTHDQVAKIRKIEGRLMAPCCYTQTILEHQSQEAEQMRGEVTAFVASGKSEQEIVTYYRTKYGETILVVPDGITGRLAFGIPVAVFLAAFGLLFFAIRRSTRARVFAVAEFFLSRPEAEKLALQDKIRAEIGEI